MRVSCAKILACGLVLALGLGGDSPTRAATELAPAFSAGPRPTSPVGSAPIATSFEMLADLVANPMGPSEIELAAGVHRGDLVVHRPITIRGAPGAVLEGSGSGTVVTVDAKDVTVDNVTVRRSGRRHTTEDAGIKARGERITLSHVRVEDALFGVSLQACQRCVVESTHVIGYDDDTELRGDGIKLWESHDSIVRGCLVERSRDLVVWYTRRALLEDNVVRNSRYGSHFMYAHDAKVRRSRFEANVVGVFVMYSLRLQIEDSLLAGARGAAGVGLGFKDSDAIEVRRNWLVANTVGTYLDNTPRTTSDPVVFDRNVFALNDVALRLHGGGAGLRFHGNDFRSNATAIEVDGGGDALAIDARGNHYSDYEGYDLDGDGVGDVAYEVKMLSSNLTESRPSLKFFHGSAAMAVMDAVAHAVPVFASKRLFVDPAPLVRRPDVREP